MIKLGYFHQVPSEANITIVGELMDFEDMDLVTSTDEIRKSWEFMANQFKDQTKVETFQDYVALTLGNHFLGNFVNPFLKGVGLGDSPEDVATNIVEMHEDSFKPLLSVKMVV